MSRADAGDVSLPSLQVRMCIMMSAYRPPLLIALAFLALLGGCTNTVTQAYLYRSGIQGTFAYAAGDRDMAVVVVGNPFSIGKAELDRFIVDSMQGRNRPPATHFTTAPGASARPGYSIVVLLNPPMFFNSQDACRSTAGIPTAPSGGRLQARMIFCAKDLILTEVTGNLPAMARPTEGGFAAMIGAMTRDIVPEREPNSDNDAEPLLRSELNGVLLAGWQH